MDKQKVESAVVLLDEEVPKAGARVIFQQYGGGPDEGQIIATETGFLRLGIEFLKASLVPRGHGGNPDAVDVDLEYLVSEDSTINFDLFEFGEVPPIGSSRSNDLLIPLLIIVLMLTTAVLAVIGLVTVIGWLT